MDVRKYLLNTIKTASLLVLNKIAENGNYYNKQREFYNLKSYIDNFLSNYNNDKFIVIPGLRGVGKTTLLFQLYYYLLDECKIPSKQLLYLNLDRLKDKGNVDLLDYLDVFIKDINEENYYDNNPLFIFIDESQHCNNWGLVGKIIYDETINVFMIFTGSNALNLSSDNDTARRALKKEINPLTFSEYLNLKYYYKFPDNMKESLVKMILTGDVSNISNIESYVESNIFIDIKRDIQKEWEDFIQYGGLPYTLNKSKIDSV